MADAQDSGSCEVYTSCGFKSHLRQIKGDDVTTLYKPLSSLASSLVCIEEVLQGLFASIEAREKDVRAYLVLADLKALIDEAREKADLPLRGLPIAVKDNISTLGFPFTCGSRFLEGFMPILEATVVKRLRGAAAFEQGLS